MNTEKPTYYLSAWLAVNGIQFSEVSYTQYMAERKTLGDGQEWAFVGEIATVKIIVEAYTIVRKDALRIANSFMKGQYIRYEFDLARCTCVRVEPIDRTHPPH